MNIDPLKTVHQIEKYLSDEKLHKAYTASVRLRSQLLGIIYEAETFGGATEPKLTEILTAGKADGSYVVLKIREPLPPTKELTAAVEEHWLELIHRAIESASQGKALPYLDKAFVWIEIITPKGSDNARLWDTSNRAINLIINNLKGIFFEDDNHEHMAFGVTGAWGDEGMTSIHIMPFGDVKAQLKTKLHEL